ncbi:MAG: cytosine permease [Gammaproteobacteria bacterium]|nr:cytosine permease [Gammaproteobacteria bacterium]
MPSLARLTDDHARGPVPQGEGVSGWRVAMVIVGFAITLPLMLTGSRMGLALGVGNALQAFVAGGLILMVAGSLTAMVAADARLSTYKILEFSFGRSGAKLVSALLALTLFGWYGVTAALFGDALRAAAMDIHDVHLNTVTGIVVGSSLMIAVTVFGFRALDLLSVIAVPLLVTFLLVLVARTVEDVNGQSGQNPGDIDLGVAVSMVVGTYIVGVVLVPDLCRYARSVRQGVLAIVAALGVGLPFVLAASAVPSVAANDDDLVAIMVKLGLGAPALFVIVFATWTSNANNLYSTSLGLAAVVERVAKWKITVAAGIVGTLVAIGGITDYFMPFLLALGIAIPPVAGIYLVDYFVVRGRGFFAERRAVDVAPFNPAAFAAWLLATATGAVTVGDWFALTRIPACDSLLVAGLLYFSFQRLSKR